MYNIMYLYVFQYHAKLCLSESLEACCYWKTGWKEEVLMTGGRDNHTVCIFPWCVPWYFVQSDVFMQRKIKHCTHASHTHTPTRTLKWQRWCRCNGRHAGFAQESTIYHMTTVNTHKHTHTHTGWKINQNSPLCLQDILKYVSVVSVSCTVFDYFRRHWDDHFRLFSPNSHRRLQSCSDC